MTRATTDPTRKQDGDTAPENGARKRAAGADTSEGSAQGRGAGEWMAMARPYLQLAKAAERRLLPLNLGLTSALILSRLASAKDPQRMSDLAAYVEVEPQSITSLVDRLERVGFVQREKHPTDRRAIVLAVTESGREAATQVDAALTETMRNRQAAS